MAYEWIGFILVCGGAWLLLAAVMARPMPAAVKRLLALGLLLRIVGSIARHEVLFRFYGGVGDAVVYFDVGKSYAARLHSLDFSIFTTANWWAGHWWGTQFLHYVTGIVIALVGPTMRGSFLVFSLLSFCGLGLFGLAFHRAYPHVPVTRYLTWLFLWPSLWFWPSSIGKDALMMLAIGLVTAGYVGRRDRMSWLMMIAGLGLATAIRPHVAGVAVVGLVAAQWLGLGKKMTGWGLAQAIGLLAVALFVLNIALGQLGLDDVDVEGIQEFVEVHAGLTAQGGSNIGVQAAGWAQVPMAFVNILLRPFPWEAHNPPAMVASLELVFFWSVVWRRRQRIAGLLRCWRTDRYLRLGVPLGVLFVAMIGLVFGNLGIIARQRVVVLPFLFLIVESLPREYLTQLAQRLGRAAPLRPPTAARVGPPTAAAGSPRWQR